jgi:hypothetical protein
MIVKAMEIFIKFFIETKKEQKMFAPLITLFVQVFTKDFRRPQEE